MPEEYHYLLLQKQVANFLCPASLKVSNAFLLLITLFSGDLRFKEMNGDLETGEVEMFVYNNEQNIDENGLPCNFS